MAESGGHQIPPETGTTPAEAYQVGCEYLFLIMYIIYMIFLT